MEKAKKTAVVLFNLGGPDSPEAVKPFLFNLFSDPAIIMLPNPLRWLVAKLISRRRTPVAQEIYRQIGGASPLLPQTRDQAAALEQTLNETGNGKTREGGTGGGAYKCFIAMRYWHPLTAETVAAVKRYEPDEIVLLPLYPQYSVTTTGSSLIEWNRQAEKAGLVAPLRIIRDYPAEENFIVAHAELIRETAREIDDLAGFRLLFSAHGLPKKVIEAGDPYQQQVEQTCAAIRDRLGRDYEGLETVTCYQSRVGPLEWIGPATEAEIERAGRDGKNLIIVPVAFVSEHSETLVELDIEYRELAKEAGVARYLRVPALYCRDRFIKGLAELVRGTQQSNEEGSGA